MQLNPAEISELLKSKIQNLEVSADTRNQGTVVSVTDGICRIDRKSTRLNSSHSQQSRMPSSA